MKAEEVINMFRHYRHDLLNDLQLIHGYASMGNIDKIKDKLQNVLDKTVEERKLTNLNCPHFTLWVMNFNSSFENFRMSYKVQLNQADFSAFDLSLFATFEEIMQLLHKYTSKEKLYNGELIIFDESGPKINFIVTGEFFEPSELTRNLSNKMFVHSLHIDKEYCKVTLHLS